jgi:hypothetical protein
VASPADPLNALLGQTLAKVSADKARSRLSFRAGDDGDAQLDIAARAALEADEGTFESGTKPYLKALKRLRGEAVSDVRYAPGDSITLNLGNLAVLRISLKGADFEGDVAVALFVPGSETVHFHGDGLTRLSLREGK